MAEERGAFPVFSHKLEATHPFINQVLSADPVLKKAYQRHGRRNIALTTTAPAGSVSCLTQTTSGIEPAYLVSYTRRKKITATDVTSRVDFVDALGDKWQEYKVYHHGYKKWMEVTGNEDSVESSPYWKATSNDVDWEMSVKLQAAAQRWICHSLSKTCVTGDSLVETNKGLLYMDEIATNSNCQHESSAIVEGTTTRNHLGRDSLVGFVMDQGCKQVYRIVTKSGNSIKTTIDHKFILLHENDDIESWVELSELKIGDRIKLS
jgi:ribonucleotide reductase alpha subunit